MERPRIPQPKTVLLHTRNVKIVGRELGFPCVLKQPDSQFSKGVIRVESETEFRRAANEMLERSDLIIAQSYEPTDYDWRIGVLDGQPLYACRYYMAKDHWQFVKRVGNGAIVEGGHETLDVQAVPPAVLSVAVPAGRAGADGKR